MSGNDPLLLLREFWTSNQEPGLDDKNVTIGKQSFPRDTLTAWRLADGKGAQCRLDALVLTLRNAKGTLDLNSYLRELVKSKIKKADRPQIRDRKLIVQYLSSQIDDPPNIDKTLLSTGSQPSSAAGQSALGLQEYDAAQDRVYPLLSLETKGSDPLSTLESIEDVMKLERLLADRTSIMQSHRKNLSSVLKNFRKSSRSSKRPAPASARHSSRRGSRVPGQHRRKRQKAGGRPIIIVPSALTSIITLYNAKQFLQQQHFVQTSAVRKKHPQKPALVEVERPSLKTPGTTAIFDVRDDVKELSKADWDRVVAVFVLGKKWQFSGWPKHMKGVAEIFERLLGFHPYYDDGQPAPDTAKWRVEKLMICKNKRHQDKSIVTEMWRKLDRFMLSRYSHLDI